MLQLQYGLSMTIHFLPHDAKIAIKSMYTWQIVFANSLISHSKWVVSLHFYIQLFTSPCASTCKVTLKSCIWKLWSTCWCKSNSVSLEGHVIGLLLYFILIFKFMLKVHGVRYSAGRLQCLTKQWANTCTCVGLHCWNPLWKIIIWILHKFGM